MGERPRDPKECYRNHVSTKCRIAISMTKKALSIPTKCCNTGSKWMIMLKDVNGPMVMDPGWSGQVCCSSQARDSRILHNLIFF
jgi:hypothetical protein